MEWFGQQRNVCDMANIYWRQNHTTLISFAKISTRARATERVRETVFSKQFHGFSPHLRKYELKFNENYDAILFTWNFFRKQIANIEYIANGICLMFDVVAYNFSPKFQLEHFRKTFEVFTFLDNSHLFESIASAEPCRAVPSRAEPKLKWLIIMQILFVSIENIGVKLFKLV